MRMLIQICLSILFFLSGTVAIAATDDKPIVFCRPNNLIAIFLYIAEKKGFFEEERVNAKFETASNAKLCNDMVIAGKADMNVGAEGPFTYAATNNPPMKIVATLGENPENTIVARKDKGISSEHDLKGKTVGYLPGTVSYLYLMRVLERQELPKNQIKLVPLQPAAMPTALQSGIVDAICIWQPWAAQAIALSGDNALALSDPELYSYVPLLVASNDMIAKRPTAIKSVFRAFLKVEKYLAENQKEAVSILSKAVAFDEELLTKTWGKYVNRVSSGSLVVPKLERNFQYVKRDDENFSDIGVPNYAAFVDDSFFNEIVKR